MEQQKRVLILFCPFLEIHMVYSIYFEDIITAYKTVSLILLLVRVLLSELQLVRGQIYSFFFNLSQIFLTWSELTSSSWSLLCEAERLKLWPFGSSAGLHCPPCFPVKWPWHVWGLHVIWTLVHLCKRHQIQPFGRGTDGARWFRASVSLDNHSALAHTCSLINTEGDGGGGVISEQQESLQETSFYVAIAYFKPRFVNEKLKLKD